jgi:hypothetical protein
MSKKITQKDQKIIANSKKGFEQNKMWLEEAHNNFDYEVKFTEGDQWSGVKQRNLPVFRLVKNITGQFRDYAVNSELMNPSIPKFKPYEEDQVKMVDGINGLTKKIINNEGNSRPFRTAYSNLISGGMGFFRVLSEFVPGTFDQNIRFEEIKDSKSVIFEEDAKENFKNAKKLWLTKEISMDTFKKDYPDSVEDIKLVQHDDPWVVDNKVKIIEYFEVKKKPKTIFKIQINEIVAQEQNIQNIDNIKIEEEKKIETNEVKIVSEEELKELEVGTYDILDEREEMDQEIQWYKMTPVEILDREILDDKYIPVIPMLGTRYTLPNTKKIVFRSMIRDLIDLQKELNFVSSKSTETISLAPKVPFVCTPEQIAGYEDMWSDVNNKSLPFILYNYDARNPGPPQRVVSNASDQSLIQIQSTIIQQMQSITGIFDTGRLSLGTESGELFKQKTKAMEVAIYLWKEIKKEADKYLGLILLDLIPKKYDSKRIIRIETDEGEEKTLTFNSGEEGENNVEIPNELKLEIAIVPGQDYKTQREETANNLLEYSRLFPNVAQNSADIITESFDFKGAKEMSYRAKAMIPPEILATSKAMRENNQVDPVIINMAQQQQQLQQTIQQQQQQLQQMNLVLGQSMKENLENSKEKEELALKKAQLDNSTDIQIQQMKNQNNILIQRLKMAEDTIKQLQQRRNIGTIGKV